MSIYKDGYHAGGFIVFYKAHTAHVSSKIEYFIASINSLMAILPETKIKNIIICFFGYLVPFI